MAGKRLAHAVHVEHPVTGERTLLLPGAEVPAGLAAQITNPDAWEPDPDGGTEPEPAPDDAGPAKPARARKAPPAE
ncbi:hypothetical protein ACIQ9P_04110 [Kitasatospora sp. NPDC094019]|uniref:hypothetical protein n=1 Tax=Kitasatospora sp. NPDC094019 TaxID=3364091 RepID=UPI0037FDD66A